MSQSKYVLTLPGTTIQYIRISTDQVPTDLTWTFDSLARDAAKSSDGTTYYRTPTAAGGWMYGKRI